MADRKLNWAIVGLGDIVRKRVGAAILAQPQSSLRACVTRDAAARADDLAALKPERVYTELEPMLADPEVDAVYLATPVYLHAPQAIAALKAGKHVLVEKPMALNTREADEMVEVANQCQRQLAVAYYRRFWPTFDHVNGLIQSSELGQIVLVRMALHSWFAPAPDDPKAWRVKPEQAGGGVLHDVGSHRLDLLAWWLGLPQRMVAEVGNHTHGYAADDSATALLIFCDKIPCTVSFHWNSKTWADDLHIVGTEASIAFSALDGDEMTITRGREATRSSYTRHANAHYGLIDDFAGAICAGRRPRFNGVDGLAATRIMDWMTQSSAAGTWVEAR